MAKHCVGRRKQAILQWLHALCHGQYDGTVIGVGLIGEGYMSDY